VIGSAAFTLTWSWNGDADHKEAARAVTSLGVWFVDIPPSPSAGRLHLAFGEEGIDATDATIDIV
jgi:hypothetical protein